MLPGNREGVRPPPRLLSFADQRITLVAEEPP
jgi:hypothetical protein